MYKISKIYSGPGGSGSGGGGGSTFNPIGEVTIDITGLTNIDLSAANSALVGIINLSSSNASETINSFTNFSTNNRFELRPVTPLQLNLVETLTDNMKLVAPAQTIYGNKRGYISFQKMAGLYRQKDTVDQYNT